MKLKLIVLQLALALFLCDLCVASLPSSPRRSRRWDEHIRRLLKEHRAGRQASPCTATYKYESASCPIADVTQFDALKRRSSGILVDVQSQGVCGSCWTFAASHMYSDYRSLSLGQQDVTFSPQELAECGRRDKSGCCGGRGPLAAMYFMNTGTVTEQCKPYALMDRKERGCNDDPPPPPLTCRETCASSAHTYNPSSFKHQNFGYIGNLATQSEIIGVLDMGGTVYLSIIVDKLFSSYTCGVHRQLSTTRNGHAVEIVDYGTTNTGCDFWVIKNSWGSSWGENGFIRIDRSSINARYFVFPTSISSHRALRQDISNISVPSDCDIEEVENPSDDELIQAAAEFGLEELTDLRIIECPDGSIVEKLTLISVTGGTTQCVEGLLIDITVEANVLGCGETDITATVEMDIYMYTNGSLSLTGYVYNPPQGGSAIRPTAFAAGVLALLLFLAGLGLVV